MNNKKIIALLLSIAMVLSNTTAVHAEEIIENTDIQEEVNIDTDVVDENEVQSVTETEILDDIEMQEEEQAEMAVEAEEELPPAIEPVMSLSAEEIVVKKALISHFDEIKITHEGTDYVPGEILVMAESEEQAEEYAELYSGELVKYSAGNALIRLNKESQETTVMDAVRASMSLNSHLPAAYPNYIRYAYALDESDPYIEESSDRYQWFHTLIGSKYAWANGYTGKKVKVAVIDTGCVTDNEEVITQADCPIDDNGHGTKVSALIAGTAKNKMGGRGVAPGSSLYVIKANSANTVEFTSDALIDALQEAKDNGCKLVNLSLGGTGYSYLEEQKIKELYNSGIAVFCAAGDNASGSSHYPAAYDGAIAVASVDKAGQATTTTDYGAYIDFAFPGVDIWTLGLSDYENTNGTSMACAIATGTAALTLQWALDNKKIDINNSKSDVDNLTGFMRKGAIRSQSSGMGSGYTSLPKMMGLSTNSTKPNKVVFSTPYEEEGYTYRTDVYGEAGTKVYYSMSGKTPTVKNGTVINYDDVIDLSYSKSKPIVFGGAKQVTIKAIAVNNTTNLSSPVASVTYKLQHNVDSVTVLPADGMNNNLIARGTGMQFTASVVPSYATKTAVKWEIVGNPVGVAVSSSGYVKVSNAATVNAFSVRANSTDGSGVFGEYSCVIPNTNYDLIKTIKAKYTSVTVKGGTFVEIPIAIETQKGLLKYATDLEWKQQGKGYDSFSFDNKGINVWTSSTEGGTAKFTGKAKDGSGKQIVITVVNTQKKVVPVTDLKIKLNDYVVAGKSIPYSIDVAPSNATDTRVSWSIEPRDGLLVFDGTKGVIKTDSSIPSGSVYMITARLKSNPDVYDTVMLKVTNRRARALKLINATDVLFTRENRYGSPTSATIGVDIEGAVEHMWDVQSSNSQLVSVTKDMEKDEFTMKVEGRSTGTATITVHTTDGTNLKKIIKVKVKNPGSSVSLIHQADRCNNLAKGKSMSIRPIIETEYGPIDSAAKKFEWSSSNPEVIYVDKSGNVKALQSSGMSTITATATDGSKMTASYDVYAVDALKRLDIVKVTDNQYKVVPETKTGGDWYPDGRSDRPYTVVANSELVSIKTLSKNMFGLNVKKGAIVTLTVKSKTGDNVKSSIKVDLR